MSLAELIDRKPMILYHIFLVLLTVLAMHSLSWQIFSTWMVASSQAAGEWEGITCDLRGGNSMHVENICQDKVG